jgi:hypothetical protein
MDADADIDGDGSDANVDGVLVTTPIELCCCNTMMVPLLFQHTLMYINNKKEWIAHSHTDRGRWRNSNDNITQWQGSVMMTSICDVVSPYYYMLIFADLFQRPIFLSSAISHQPFIMHHASFC